jgi:hypothetical protein
MGAYFAVRGEIFSVVSILWRISTAFWNVPYQAASGSVGEKCREK